MREGTAGKSAEEHNDMLAKSRLPPLLLSVLLLPVPMPCRERSSCNICLCVIEGRGKSSRIVECKISLKAGREVTDWGESFESTKESTFNNQGPGKAIKQRPPASMS